ARLRVDQIGEAQAVRQLVQRGVEKAGSSRGFAERIVPRESRQTIVVVDTRVELSDDVWGPWLEVTPRQTIGKRRRIKVVGPRRAAEAAQRAQRIGATKHRPL